MQQNEVNTIIQNIPYLDRNEKEIDRYKLYVSVQANSKKKIKLEEILPLVWDKENKVCNKITQEESDALRNRAKELENKLSHMTFTEKVDLETLRQ